MDFAAYGTIATVACTFLAGIWKLSSQVTKVQLTVTNTSGDLSQVKAELKDNTRATEDIREKVAAISERVARLEAHNSNRNMLAARPRG